MYTLKGQSNHFLARSGGLVDPEHHQSLLHTYHHRFMDQKSKGNIITVYTTSRKKIRKTIAATV